jgi:hypothetical protein
MQADSVARNVRECRIDGRDHAIDEAKKVAERFALVEDVAFHRKIGAIKLQQEAVSNDGLVLDATRFADGSKIGFLVGVEVVAQRGGDDAWRRSTE